MVSSLSMMNGRKIYFFQKMKCDNQTLMQQLDSIMLGSNETILSQKLLGKQKTDICISFGLDWICFKSFSKNHVHQQTNCQKRLCSFVYLFSILSWVKLIFFFNYTELNIPYCVLISLCTYNDLMKWILSIQSMH